MALPYLQPGSASWPPISDAPERVGQSDDVLAKDRIGAAQPPNQFSDLRPDHGPTASASTLPRPVAPEPLPVPADHGLWPHHPQRIPPALPAPRQHGPEDPVHSREPGSRLARLPHSELLPKREVLQRQLPVRANRGSQCPNEDPEPSDHDWPNSLIRSKRARESRRTSI